MSRTGRGLWKCVNRWRFAFGILEIADCYKRVNFEFDLDLEEARANSRHKLDSLISALRVFRTGLVEEAAQYERRERELKELKGE
jgi:hypothetical protein